MLKIHCPQCNRSFFWTDGMPTQDKCPTPDCSWNYNIHAELKKNVTRRTVEEKPTILLCPSCQREISSKLTICPHCGLIIMGKKTFRKRYFFLVLCLILVVLSVILKYWIK